MTSPDARPPIETLVIAPGNVTPKYLRATTDTSLKDGFHNSKLATLIVLFLITAVLGIPMLWRNQRFSLFERVFWSIVITAYTIGIIFGLVWWVRASIAMVG